jgi:hypothetical protein
MMGASSASKKPLSVASGEVRPRFEAARYDLRALS